MDRHHHGGYRRVHLFGHAAIRPGQLAAQWTEALAQAAPVEAQAAVHIDQVAGARQAAAEADRAKAPAAAKPEPRLRAVFFESGRAEQGLRRVDRQQTFENGGGFFFTIVAIEFACVDGLRQPGGEIDRRELVGQIRAIGFGERADQSVQVFALGVAELARRDRRAQHLAHAQPVAVQVIGRQAEAAWPSAHQPAEDDAAANVQQAPAPIFDRTEQFAGLGRQQREGHFLVGEVAEQALRRRDFGLAVGLGFFGFVSQRLQVACALQVFFQNRPVHLDQSRQNDLKFRAGRIGIVGFGATCCSAVVAHVHLHS